MKKALTHRCRMLPLLIFALSAPPAGLPVAPPPRPAGLGLLPGADPSLADWTPRPALGHFEPWERATDKDWIDARLRQMDTGPFFDCTMRYPLGKGNETVYKATAVKLGPKGEAGAVFDRCTMRLAAAWTGGFLNHSDRRFGLINTPTPKGEIVFAAPAGPGWADPQGKWDAKVSRFTAPLPKEWVKYRGLYLHGDDVVFSYSVGGTEVRESLTHQIRGGIPGVVSTFEVAPHEQALSRYLAESGADEKVTLLRGGGGLIHTSAWGESLQVVVVGNTLGGKVTLSQDPLRKRLLLDIDPNRETARFRVAIIRCPKPNAEKLLEQLAKFPFDTDIPNVTKGGPKRWGAPIVTKLERGNADGQAGLGNPPPVPQTPPAFAVDTLTIPYKNRFGALFFCTGLDFLPDGRVAVCTCHGDVWLVTVDEKAGTCSWQRYATGLYHPLGLKVVDGKVVVLERGQLTRLHDLNDDGEADFYECVNNDWHTGTGEHSYDTCLETDPHGNFYFFKTGDTELPTGGCLMRVSKDGSKSEVFATGFRHPIGLGMSPAGVLTGADQEGNWMPATRIDEYRKGGFYGDMRAHHRPTAPATYDPPLCWLPREIDNSAGGQVWVPKDATAWGALAGVPLHLSYGRCKAFVLLRQELPDSARSGPKSDPARPAVQGGVAPLGVSFLSGVCRGRFRGGALYVCGLNGWQTAAQADGCLQRVRPTGKPFDLPTAMEVTGDTIRLTFSRPLDPTAAALPEHYRAARWNYRWSGDYGSKRWKVSDPTAEGQDDVPVRSAKLSGDGRTLELAFESVKPAMQMMVGYNVKAADGRPVVGSIYLTVHTTGK